MVGWWVGGLVGYAGENGCNLADSVYECSIHFTMRQAIYNSQCFEWDDGNSEKNWLLHEVTDGECEQ